MSVNSGPGGAQGAPDGAGRPTAGPAAPQNAAAADPAADSPVVRRARVRPAGMRRTRMGGLWVLLAAGAVILILLLVFILQNSQRVQVHVLGAHLTAPLGVLLLLAAALGLLLVVVPGGLRIIQLKRAARGLHRDRLDLAHQLDEVTAAPGTAGTGVAATDGSAANRPVANMPPVTNNPAADRPATRRGRRASRNS